MRNGDRNYVVLLACVLAGFVGGALVRPAAAISPGEADSLRREEVAALREIAREVGRLREIARECQRR